MVSETVLSFVEWINKQDPRRQTNQALTYEKSPLGEYYSEVLKQPLHIHTSELYRELHDCWLLQDINVCKNYADIHKMFIQKTEAIGSIYNKQIWEPKRNKRK